MAWRRCPPARPAHRCACSARFPLDLPVYGKVYGAPPARPVQRRGGSVMTATHVNHQGTGRRRAIGPLGTTARVLVGGLLVGSVTWGHLTRGFHPAAWLLGLVGFPALRVAGQWLRTRRTPTPCGPPARSPTRSTWPCSWRCTCWRRTAT